jgi:CheY-specific phosphatase CheX
MKALGINETLLETVLKGTLEGLSMTGIAPDPVGVARHLSQARGITVIVSFYGERNGNMALSMSSRTANFFASKLLMEEITEISEDTLDAIGELGNMVAGRYKDMLSNTKFSFDKISLPSLVFGSSYKLYNYRGIKDTQATSSGASETSQREAHAFIIPLALRRITRQCPAAVPPDCEH